MDYPLSSTYDPALVREKIMGPNPLKLTEELLRDHRIPSHATVLDLGSGTGITSVFLAREYGFQVFAADLWSDPGDNMRFFEQMGLTPNEIVPIKTDATGLPFATEFFDAVVSIDSYNYFGRDPEFLGNKLLPYVKSGGYLYLTFPGMVHDCHDELPSELLLSWTPDQLDYLHDIDYWTQMIGCTSGVEVVSLHEMEGTDEAWADWLVCDNDYARGDRASMEAGAGEYLNFIAAVLRKK